MEVIAVSRETLSIKKSRATCNDADIYEIIIDDDSVINIWAYDKDGVKIEQD